MLEVFHPIPTPRTSILFVPNNKTRVRSEVLHLPWFIINGQNTLVRTLRIRCISLNVAAAIIVVVSNGEVADLVADLEPAVTGRRDGEEPTAQIVHPAADDEAGKEVDVVNVCCADGDLVANCAL